MPRRSQGGAALPRIASRFLNTPVCFERARLEALLASLQHPVDPKAFGLWFEASGPSAPEYQRVERVAVVPVHGPLANRHDEYAWWMGWSSYEGIKAAIAGALEDPAIESILLDVDSPGGEMCGLLDLVDWIRAQRDAGAKPITSVANEFAFSAAYAIASATDRIALPRTGGVGSVGVLYEHVDFSRMEKGLGIAFEAIFAGARKNDYTEHEPLSGTARALMQGEVDRVYELFVETVAKNRPQLTAEKVRETEAGLFWGREALEAGLADVIENYDAALEAAFNPGSSALRMVTRRSTVMAEKPKASAGAEPRLGKVAGKAMETDKKMASDLTDSDADTDDEESESDGEGENSDADTDLGMDAEDGELEESDADTGKGSKKGKTEGAARVPAVVDLDAERSRIRGEVRAEAVEIVSACKLAGMTGLAAELLAEEGMTLATARARIQAKRDGGSGREIDNHHDGAGDKYAKTFSLSSVYDRLNGRVRE